MFFFYIMEETNLASVISTPQSPKQPSKLNYIAQFFIESELVLWEQMKKVFCVADNFFLFNTIHFTMFILFFIPYFIAVYFYNHTLSCIIDTLYDTVKYIFHEFCVALNLRNSKIVSDSISIFIFICKFFEYLSILHFIKQH